jgi:hypothetical protein
MYIKIYDDKELEKLFSGLYKQKIMFTQDTDFSRNIGKKYHKLIDKDLLEIAHSKKKHKSWIIVPPDVKLVQHNKTKYEFIRLF